MPKGRPSNAPRTKFGARLCEIRQRSGLTQQEVADKLGITARAYAFWERKPVAINPDQLSNLADLFKVSADLLLGREPLKNKKNGPKSKLEKVFEEASVLPSAKQTALIGVIEPFIQQHSKRSR